MTDSGEKSAGSMGDGRTIEPFRRGRAVEVEPGSTVDASVISDDGTRESCTRESSPRGTRTDGAGRMTKVAWLDTLEMRDLFSCLDVDRDTHEPRDDGRVSGVSTSFSFVDTGVSGRFLCPDKSVSGGDGGRSS